MPGVSRPSHGRGSGVCGVNQVDGRSTRLSSDTEEIKVSWSGRKRCYDTILVECLWWALKYEDVYLRAYSDGWGAEINLDRFLWRYCHVIPHFSLGGKTPYAVYIEAETSSSARS